MFYLVSIVLLVLLPCAVVAFLTSRPRDFPRNVPVIPLWLQAYNQIFGQSRIAFYNTKVRPQAEKHGAVAVWQGSCWSIVISRPDYLAQVFKDSNKDLEKSGIWSRVPRSNGGLLFGENIIDSDGQLHADFCNILKPALLQRFAIDFMRSESCSLANRLHQEQQLDVFDVGISIDSLIWRWAVTIYSHYFMDIDEWPLSFEQTSAQKITALQSSSWMARAMVIFNVAFSLPWRPASYSKAAAIIQQLEDTLVDIAESRNFPASGTKELKMVHHLVRARHSGKLSDFHYRSNLKQLLVAGHENVEAALQSAMFNLAVHVDIQEQLHGEVMKMLPSDYSAADLDRLPLLAAVIYETLRLYPPLGTLTNRRTVKPMQLGSEILLPTGTMVGWNVLAVQTDPQVWGESAREFDPFRWGHDIDSIKSMARSSQARGCFVPFSLHSRRCLGSTFAQLELKVALCELVAASAQWARMLSRARRPIATTAISGQRLQPTASASRHVQCQYRNIGTTSANRATLAETSWAAPPAEEKRGPQTLTEKIIQDHAVGLPAGKTVRSGSFVSVKPWRLLTHDNTAAVMGKVLKWPDFKGLKDPKQMVFAIDHDVQNKSETNLKKYKMIEAFAEQNDVAFYPAGHGISHQVMIEELFVWPGKLCVGSDSHSTSYSALGAGGFSVVRTDAAGIWATGQTWFQVPPVAKVNFTGVLPPGVAGKDVIVALCGLFQSDVLNHAVEFSGSEETMASIPIDDRISISNMCTEWGALTGLFPVDKTLERWLRYKATEAAMFPERNTIERITHEKVDELYANPPRADPNAQYAKQLYINLSTVSPYVSGPNSVKISTPLNELAPKKIKVDKAYIVSCTNSRASDLAAAAKVFKDAAKANGGKIPKIADGVKLYIAAASAREQEAAEDAGDWQALLEAGSIELPAACGPCIGMGAGLLEPGEVGISASNRNFKGRMGSRDALAYLSSPEVVAASALNGFISGTDAYTVPEDYKGVEHGYGTGAPETTESQLGSVLEQLESLIDRVESSAGGDESAQGGTQILSGFPEKISGEIVFCDMDNLDTDNIYAGKYTYQDDLTKETMAQVCMENYDPAFRHVAKPNDILVSGYNFGCGSSREQAATALLAKQIPLVVSGSFGSIFSRNSINNGLLGLEVPRLVERLRAVFTDKVTTRRTGWTLTWDVARSVVQVQEGEGGEQWEEKVGEFPANLQEIIAKGGLEKWIMDQMAKE
ncbi:mitochondrial Homoaconitase [Beauveria asiatica]|uniref:Homoaconitase, mitochondrial n=1 Tax=Beauveria asiatica TaxID=1069075 RepID=A0AAW0S4A9_9HYPO